MNLVTPLGFRDVLPAEAGERERITRAVQDLFAARGYLPIETPTLEVMDVMARGGRMPASSFKFFDSQGDLLAMRPDVTLQIARMAATRMGADADQLKMRYTQRIFRDVDAQGAAQAREMTQIGIEDIGPVTDAHPDPDVVAQDVEIVQLCVGALAACGVPQVVLALATVGPLRALLDRSGAPEGWKHAVLNAYHASDLVEVDRLCDPANLCEGTAPAYAQAIQRLARIQANVLIDFSVISSFDYYTGLVFEAFAPNLGNPLGSGGRYDNLLGAYGSTRPAAGFAIYLEHAMEAAAAPREAERPLRIAVPKGALHAQAVECLQAAGLATADLDDPGRQMIIRVPGIEYIIVRPSDAPAFVASGAADCGICGRDSLDEAALSVVQLTDLRFGGCRFVVAQPAGAQDRIADRYRRLGSIRVATKYPRIAHGHFARTGMQVEIVKLNGNIELAPLTGIADCIVDITATGTTLRENDLCIVEDVLDSTARFFANPCALRTDERIVELARALATNAEGSEYDPIAGGTK